MKIRDIIQNLDKTPSNEDDGIIWDLEKIYSALHMDCYSSTTQDETSPRLRCYWLGKHRCTDSWVGIRTYFLDEDFVAISYQRGRKCHEDFCWESVEAANSVRLYLMSLEESVSESEIELINMEEDLGEGYCVEFTGQLLTKQVFYNGSMVEVVRDSNEGYTNFHTIIVKMPDGIQEDVDVRDVLVPWPLITQEEITNEFTRIEK